MGWSFLGKFAMWVVIILAQVNGHIGGCLDRERRGLLEFKDFLKSNGADADHLLPTWVEKPDHHSECCFEKLSTLRKLETLNLEWNEFDDSILPSLSALRSLKMLNLRANKIEGLFPPHELAYFGNLERLDLSYNQFNDIQGCESLSRLEKLETLYLTQYESNRENKFNKSIILCLSSLISLKNLSLQGNNLGDPFPARDSKLLSNLSKMRHLNLSNNNFDKDAFRILGALPSLKFLSLESNRIEGPLSNQELTYNLSNLEVLLLRGNQLNGTPPMEGLTSFRHLEILDLSRNNFFASITPSIGALSSLKALSLAQNNLNGSLPIQGLCKLKKLEELDLSYNLFEGILPPCLSNMRSLKFFDISLNQFMETFLHLCLEAFTPSSTLVLVIIVSRVYSHSAHLQTIQTLRWLN
ncbi:Receptor-like protein 14 [Camellia lanceoleosa]|nr:Receptor-like protein 14 [Camellia lanceoleosa]